MSTKYSKETLTDSTAETVPKKPSFMKDNQVILRKLGCVFLLAGLFMVIEIIGGILAGSIAIMSDAAHMLSDLLGFTISIISVWVSGFPANKKHSYGFHRAGVLGALASVIVIWILTGFLMYFAVLRIIHIDQVELEGRLMFFVACIGLIMNLIMVKVLHGDHGGHSHCSHGHSHNHSHGHEDNHDHPAHSHADDHDHHSEKKHSKHSHNHKENHHHDLRQEPHENDRKNEHYLHVHNHIHKLDQKHEKKSGEQGHSNDRKSEENYHKHQDQRDKFNFDVEGRQDQMCMIKVLNNAEKEMELILIHQNEPSHTKHKDPEADGSSLEKKPSLSGNTSKNNLNVRATIIHIIGDILQSIGVIIASALIWAFPEKMKLADPALTFIFAVIILFTTFRITKDCISMLMEGTPEGFDVEGFEADIRKLDGVVEVHDLHVWSLGEGKPAVSIHIHTDVDMAEMLRKATEVCRMHGIYHSTIQLEITREKGSQNYIDCDHNVH